ncbi:MAG TPA: SCO family protein [Kofleriaceae bacterium]|jgi:protein SCO1/2|nr:SCO family protein [Kofleriaceae bacterium]
MDHTTRRHWIVDVGTLIGAALFGPAAVAEPDRPPRPAAPRPGRPAPLPPRELIRRRHLPNVALKTHEGRAVRFYDDLVKDKNVVINFMYAHCVKSCPTTTSNLVRVQKALKGRVGRDIFFYSVTLKPAEDTPAVLKEYAARHGAGPGWTFLTGRPEDIETLRRSLGFISPDPTEDADTSNHVGMLRVGNEPMMRWSACPGQASPEWIVTTIVAEIDGAARVSR